MVALVTFNVPFNHDLGLKYQRISVKACVSLHPPPISFVLCDHNLHKRVELSVSRFFLGGAVSPTHAH